MLNFNLGMKGFFVSGLVLAVRAVMPIDGVCEAERVQAAKLLLGVGGLGLKCYNLNRSWYLKPSDWVLEPSGEYR